jgi:hypothetical protein
MRKNTLMAGDISQRKQSYFYLDDNSPRSIQRIYTNNRIIRHNVICFSTLLGTEISLCNVNEPFFLIKDDDDDMWEETYFNAKYLPKV